MPEQGAEEAPGGLPGTPGPGEPDQFALAALAAPDEEAAVGLGRQEADRF
jgi:hypothetical protein